MNESEWVGLDEFIVLLSWRLAVSVHNCLIA